MKKLLSQREYARHRASRRLSGTSAAAVQRAIKSGRISRALVEVDGKVRVDAEVADAEWEGKTRLRSDYHVTGAAPAPDDRPGAPVPYREYRRAMELAEAVAVVALEAGTERDVLFDRVAARWLLADEPDNPRDWDVQQLDELLEEAEEDMTAERDNRMTPPRRPAPKPSPPKTIAAVKIATDKKKKTAQGDPTPPEDPE